MERGEAGASTPGPNGAAAPLTPGSNGAASPSTPGSNGAAAPSTPGSNGAASPSAPGSNGAVDAGLAAVPEPPRSRLIVFRLSNAVARILLRLLCTRIVVEGREHIPDRPGVILASNHLSILDPVILTLVIDSALRRRVRYMAKSEALNWPLFGLLLRHYGGFAVRRGTADREAYRTARNVLAGGDWLGLAPEGTRSRTGALGEPKPGVALLAMRSGAVVLPAGIWGTERLWPVGAHFPRFRATVTVRFGEPYEPAAGQSTADGAAGGRPAADTPGDLGRDAGAAPPAIGARAPAGKAERHADAPPADRVGRSDAAAPPTGAERPGEAVRGDLAKEPRPGPATDARARRRQSVDAATEDLMRRIAVLLPAQYRGRFG